MAEVILLEAKDIVKDFPGVRALDHVDFQLRKGEIHAILGENGAGKSTLIKIFGGVYKHDSGTLYINGEAITYNSPRQAQLKGIRVIHQELNLLPLLSVAENIFLGNLPDGKIPGFVDWPALHAKAKEILDHLQVDIDLNTRAGDLNSGEQQIVEIAQALTSDVQILVMDEPTAALNDTEIDHLFNFLQRMSSQGIGIIYITHRIPEVMQIADRVTVLRDGNRIGTVEVEKTTKDELVQMMVGRSLTEMYPRQRVEPGKVLLEVKNICSHDRLKNISFKLHGGEVLGVYGLLGAGRSLLAKTLFGALPLTSGQILVNGELVEVKSPHHAKMAGIGYVPSERKTESLIGPLSMRKNVTIASLSNYVRQLVFINENAERQSVNNWIDKLNIRTPSTETLIGSLSGGNQQKVVLSRWLDSNVKVLILNEPTRGVDVGAKVEIYRLVDHLCKEGHAILMFSSEMPELLAISDRLLVMSAGEITGEFTYDNVTQEQLVACAIAGL